VALLDDDAMIELGRDHLGKSHPTDVIAFSLYEDGEPVLGDVYIGARQAERQAVELGVSLDEEWVRLVVHRTLHVLGMDHPEDAEKREASPMYLKQEGIVRALMAGAAGPVGNGPPP
jgi:probable rRNA maturation factor